MVEKTKAPDFMYVIGANLLMPNGSKLVYDNIQQNAEPTGDSIAKKISRKRLSISSASNTSVSQNWDLSRVRIKDLYQLLNLIRF